MVPSNDSLCVETIADFRWPKQSKRLCLLVEEGVGGKELLLEVS